MHWGIALVDIDAVRSGSVQLPHPQQIFPRPAESPLKGIHNRAQLDSRSANRFRVWRDIEVQVTGGEP